MNIYQKETGEKNPERSLGLVASAVRDGRYCTCVTKDIRKRLPKGPTKEIYDLQKRLPKESCTRDQQRRSTKDIYTRDLQKRPVHVKIDENTSNKTY